MEILSKIRDSANTLKFETFGETIENLMSKNVSLELLSTINEIFTKEISFKKERAARIGLKVANFPFQRTIEDYDFNFQKNANKPKILSLSTLNFIDKNENIIFSGTPGVGKTHLAVAMGINAVKSKKSTYFIGCHKLIHELKKAHYEGRVNHRIKKFAGYKLLIIDEIGYLPFDELSGKLLFQLVNARYTKNPTIITTNLSLDKWQTLFHEPVIGMALLDRLLENSHIISIVGNSYRTKELYNELEGGKTLQK